MKSPRLSIALYFVLLTALLLAAAWRTWESFHTYLPTPETESAFFKNYTPANVLKRFNNGQGASGGGRGAAAGHDSVTHTANFEGYFGMCSENFMPLMNALRDDVAAQLSGNGAQIVSEIGVAEAGFHFDYKLGKSVGSVIIAPLQLHPDLSSLKNSRPNCMVDIQTQIDVSEKWFAKEPGSTQISANNSIR